MAPLDKLDTKGTINKSMSPLTIDRIKKANGKVRIKQLNDPAQSTCVMTYVIQVLEEGVWKTVFTDRSQQICEQAVRKAVSQVILG